MTFIFIQSKTNIFPARYCHRPDLPQRHMRSALFRIWIGENNIPLVMPFTW